MKYKTIFGPVKSRRLGISLGIDPLTEKTCTQDCIYCEVGKTSEHCDLTSSFFPLSVIQSELQNYFKDAPKVDFVTIAGKGEPTLYPQLKELITFLKSISQCKIAVITNSTLFNQKKVREALLLTDLVVPSLDASSQEEFIKINQPCNNITFQNLVEGLKTFSQEYKNQLWLEIFLVENVNTSNESIHRFRKIIETLRYDKIHLNTLDRPGTDKLLVPASNSCLELFQKQLNLPETEIISRSFLKNLKPEHQTDLLSTLTRRPLTFNEIAETTGISPEELNNLLKNLLEEEKIQCEEINQVIFYSIPS